MSNTEQNDMQEQSGKKLILTTATWCGPCYGLKKRLEKDGFYSKIEIRDADKEQPFFREHNIKSVPTLLIIDSDANTEYVQGVEDIYKAIAKNVA